MVGGAHVVVVVVGGGGSGHALHARLQLVNIQPVFFRHSPLCAHKLHDAAFLFVHESEIVDVMEFIHGQYKTNKNVTF